MSEAVPDPYSNFDADYAKTQQDMIEYNDAVEKQKKDADLASEKLDEALAMLEGSGADQMTESALIYELAVVVLLVAGSLEDQQIVYASAATVNGDLTNLTNDIQDDTNSDSTVEGATGALAVSASNEDAMLDLISDGYTDPATGTTIMIASIIGSSAANTVYSNTKDMRDDIVDEDDPEGDKYNPTDTSTVHFDVDGVIPNTMTSYAQMQQDEGTPGNPNDASGAQQNITDNINSSVSTLSSVNSAFNVDEENLSNLLEEVYGVGENGFQELEDTEAVALQNQVAGS